jgi:DNA-binding NarL/FixJ family response regulator
MDIKMPGKSEVDLLSEIYSDYPDTVVMAERKTRLPQIVSPG